MINLLINGVFLLLGRAQVHQLRALGLLQVEFLGGDGIIESGLFNGDGNLVVILRPVQLDVGWVVNTLKILVVGVLGQKFVDEHFESCRLAGHTWNQYGIKTEETVDHPDIFVCGTPKVGWPEFWKDFRYYG